jgi:eukaryotic-like serine/threonine-protein kinase
MQLPSSVSASLSWRAPRAAGHDAQAIDAPPRVPGYRVLRQIGKGRLTTTWLAWDLNRKSDVVLKIEPASGGTLERDCVVAARVQSPLLVRVHGHGRTAQWAFVSMEHVPGGDLARRMRTPLARADALRLFAEAVAALAQLHRQHLVHRDVKPANFLLREDGALVLADFGLAVESGTLDPAAREGAIVGTPRYVAPEQLQGEPAAPSADVYSLGVLLYEMLCGQAPFPGETLMEICSQKLFATPAPLPACSADLQPLVNHMLCKEVQCRLPDADAVLGLLGQRF